MKEEFEVGAHTYRCGKLSAFDQYDVARKFAPVILWLGGMTGDEPVADPRKFAQVIVSASEPISREDSNFVLNMCLATVSRKQAHDAGWSPIMGGNRNLMFEDIDMPQMLELLWHVLKANRLIDFFSVSPSASTGQAPKSSS